jgi:predicted small secreted protein
MRKAFITLILLTAVTGALSACNTVDGAGRDIENAGEWVQEKF